MFFENQEDVLTANGPIQITFYWTPTASVTTSVFGSNRENASVAFYSGAALVYSATLLQFSPNATLPELILGNLKIAAGTTLMLSIPSPMQMGSVLMNGTITVPPSNPSPYEAFIAQWALTSSSSSNEKDESTGDNAEANKSDKY